MGDGDAVRVMMAQLRHRLFAENAVSKADNTKYKCWIHFSKHGDCIGNKIPPYRTLSRLLCVGLSSITKPAIIYALWPNVRILATRRCSHANSSYFDFSSY